MEAQLCSALPRQEQGQAGGAGSRSRTQEKAQSHVPWGLVLPGNDSFFPVCDPNENKSSANLHH